MVALLIENLIPPPISCQIAPARPLSSCPSFSSLQQGIMGLAAAITCAVFTTGMLINMEFTDDCAYHAVSPWKDPAFGAFSALILILLVFYAHSAHRTRKLPNSVQRLVNWRVAVAACVSLIPTFVADGFVLYFGTGFGMAACLNACTWFLLSQMMSMQYATLTVNTLGLQV